MAELHYPPRLLGASEAARYLGVSISTLSDMGLPRRMIGTRRLYDRSDLDALADTLPTDKDTSENTCDVVFG
ncbi:helix-turn-helix domain-containing protein [Ketogulonicigenium robustum]|uniref:helix-turn-helix domain-containing protein n=1 Tax=Ketogulonicigenium robustum TaxID=92947 RepID=UPI000A2718CB|nr:helix-turn-helix domain-containing protein [Ketogulonicigenium robustum]